MKTTNLLICVHQCRNRIVKLKCWPLLSDKMFTAYVSASFYFNDVEVIFGSSACFNPLYTLFPLCNPFWERNKKHIFHTFTMFVSDMAITSSITTMFNILGLVFLFCMFHFITEIFVYDVSIIVLAFTFVCMTSGYLHNDTILYINS